MPDRLTPQDLAARVTVFDVDDLTLWDANPNKADEDSIHASMEEWGQTATILVATDGNGRRVVVDGNHRVAAERKARRFGGKLAGIDVTGLDWTDVRAFAAGLALNRTARLGADDEGLLAAILTQIGAEDATPTTIWLRYSTRTAWTTATTGSQATQTTSQTPPQR